MLYELLTFGILICIVLSLTSKDFHRALKKAFPEVLCEHDYIEYKYKMPLKNYYVVGKSCPKCKKVKKHSTHIELIEE